MIPLQESSEDQSRHPIIHCYSEFDPPPLYLEMWLAQADRILSQIDRWTFTNCEKMALGKQVKLSKTD